MFHVVPERAHDLSRWRLFVAQEVKVSGVLDEIIIWPETYRKKHRNPQDVWKINWMSKLVGMWVHVRC